MTWDATWKVLSNRIRSMIAAGLSTIERPNALNSIGIVREETKRVLEAITAFRATYAKSLPDNAASCIDDFTKQSASVVTSKEADSTLDIMRQNLSGIITRYQIFEGELTYHLSDQQHLIRARSELAFVHLQRLIVVDEQVKQLWMAAFSRREEVSEGLGAVHLLAHGIWAFKAEAAAGRTDLVFQERVPLAEAERVAEGLVLTEWKKASSPTDAEKKFVEAREQARRYVGGIGVFAGNELRGFRYAIVITEQEVRVPDDWKDPNADVVYRHINIALEPRTPSKAKS